MTMATAVPPLPLRIGTDAEFAALRSALMAAGFTEQALCERLQLEHISRFDLKNQSELREEPVDETGLLVRLLMECGPVTRAGAATLGRHNVWYALAALGLVAPAASNPDRWYAKVMLYPTRGLYIVSDRSRPEEGVEGQPPEDFVYPAIVPNTELFLELAPCQPCDAFLDLCSGTAIAALVAAKSGARQAWAFDITGRSTHFAEFNRRLNGIANMTPATGDLYEPAGDLTFDRIVAHPPYVPVYRPQLIFDSGGHDGEQIVGRIIEGLPRYLRPGGRFYALTMGTDRDQPFEQRLREWLGTEESEFDVAFVNRNTRTPREYAAEALIRNRGQVEDIKAWREMFEQLHVKTLAYGLVVIQRRNRMRPVFTVRRQTGRQSGPAEHEWLVEWETAAVAGEADRILAARPRASKHTHLRVENRLSDGEWVAEAYHLETEYPFSMELRAQAWTAYLLTCADGSRSAAELLEKLKSDGALHPETPPHQFARMLEVLVSGGFLEIDNFRLPAAK
ncbi:MAG: SAM-dependent methyltransferase [Acidobacteria bacterium]|nr:MAG: SAM-dependent methyltransferase [Acidobacteriota bacterium]